MAIQEANAGLEPIVPGWSLSRDSHYQLSNRFAWSWKIAELGTPVILVYLGFLNAGEMIDQGPPFHSAREWNDVVRSYARGVVPDDAWDTQVGTRKGGVGTAFVCPLVTRPRPLRYFRLPGNAYV